MPERSASATEWRTGLVPVAKDTYAYIQASGRAGISNAGLIVGPDRAIVLDTLATTPMAMDFIAGIRRVTDRPVNEVLLTHHHVDHILGIQNFLPARVICHARCRQEIIANGMDLPERWAKRRPQFAAGLTGIRVCLPDETFEDRVTFYLGERVVEFFHPGVPAHTAGDAMLHLPAERVLFAGDIFFYRVVPAGFQGHIGNWIKVIDRVLAMEDVDVVVPGHGPVGTKRELTETRDCLALIYEAARRAFDRGQTPEEAWHALDLGPFADWADAEERATEDIRRCYQEFRGELG